MSDEIKRQMPKGGRKGGRQFPQINLKDAIEYAKRLVSKTHTGPQPEAIILKGVFDASGGMGGVRASAMKQYGLMDGKSDGYKASELAKKIVNAPAEEQPPLLRRALLKPAVFSTLYETFKGDKATSAKVRQQAASHEVHPDNLDKCVNLFLESAEFAGVGQRDADGITLSVTPVDESANASVNNGTDDNPNESLPDDSASSAESLKQPPALKPPADPGVSAERPASGRAVIQVNIDLDSSLDTDKLEKQLALLRKYGAI